MLMEIVQMVLMEKFQMRIQVKAMLILYLIIQIVNLPVVLAVSVTDGLVSFVFIKQNHNLIHTLQQLSDLLFDPFQLH